MANENYFALAENTFRGLDEANSRLYDLTGMDPRPTGGEKAQIEIEIAQNKRRRQKVFQETLAVAQNQLVITPPTDLDVQGAKKIADDLDRMTVDANTVVAVVQATTNIMDTWNKTNPRPAAPPQAALIA